MECVKFVTWGRVSGWPELMFALRGLPFGALDRLSWLALGRLTFQWQNQRTEHHSSRMTWIAVVYCPVVLRPDTSDEKRIGDGIAPAAEAASSIHP